MKSSPQRRDNNQSDAEQTFSITHRLGLIICEKYCGAAIVSAGLRLFGCRLIYRLRGALSAMLFERLWS
jgi:hypothetical protein